MKRFALLAVLVFASAMTVGALGKQEDPPALPVESPAATVLAPANPDAVQKALTIPFAPSAAPGLVLMSWSFTVYDSAGRQVWSKTETQTKDRGFFGELFNLGEKPSVEIPTQLVWDGTDTTAPVANGVYTYIFTVTDSKGRTTRTPPYSLTVQNNPVRITKLSVTDTIFAPRGKRPTVTIRQDGSREAQWVGVFTNKEGTPVRTYRWENTSDQLTADVAPAEFQWDGRDDAGEFLPEGEYQYALTGKNRAGATATQALASSVFISERPGALRLSSDQVSFSPVADKAWPTAMALRLDSGNDEGLVEWTVTISEVTRPKVALWTKSGKAPHPATVSFDGKDLVGRVLPDGRYQAVLSANFRNGNSGESPTLPFELDTEAPRGNLKVARPVFGGTGRPTTPVEFVGDGNLDWSLDVLGSDGKTVRTLSLGNLGTASVDLNVAEGSYTLRAWAFDPAGNRGVAEAAVVKDSKPRKVALATSSPVLVPGNAANGRVTVTPTLDGAGAVEKAVWTLAAVDAKGNELRTVDKKEIEGSAPAYDWSGRDADGKSLADGLYRAALAVTWANGTTVSAQRDLKIDSTYLREPQGSLTVSQPIFGGTDRPSVLVKFEGDADLAWTLELLDKTGKVRGTYPLGSKGTAELEVPSATEGALADGEYQLKASAQSAAKVLGSTTLAVTKDSRPRKVGLDLSRAVLVPGKGVNGQVRVTPILEMIPSIDSMALEIRSPSGEVFYSAKADSLVTFWDWNPQTAGVVPPNGQYTVALAVSYNNGTLAQTTSDLKVDSAWLTEPQAALVVSSPVFGSTSRPTVSVTLTGDTGVSWVLDVLDRNNKSVRQYLLGDQGTATVDIGTDSAGKPLADGTYTLKASAKNQAGLTGSASVSVRKDTRALKIGLDLSTPVLVPGNSLNGSVKISPVLEVLDFIETTKLTITGPEGRVVNEKTWDGLIPFWDWDGRDAVGRASPDGRYQIALAVTYANGAKGEAVQALAIDSNYLKEPEGTLTATGSVFGGPGRSGVNIQFQGNPGLAWVLEILDKDGRTIRKDPLGTSGTAAVEFRGLDDKDQPLADGPYTLRASATSAAGILGTALLQLRKDSREGKASLDLSRRVLVPGKGANNVVRITPILDFVDSVEKSNLTVLGPDGKTVAERSADGTIPFWDWGAQDAKGKNLPNGAYQIALTVNYSNGSEVRARAEVKVDSTYLNDQGPLVEMTLSTKTFAPNNVDGPTDLTVTIKTTEGVVPVSSWQLQVLDPRGKTFRQWTGKGLPPKSIYWDGKAENGEAVESGEDYQLQLRVTDTQNNVTRKQESVTIDISVIKLAEGKYKIVVSSIQFAGYSSDVFKVQNDLLTKNLFVLRRLGNALGKFPGYKIRLEGYAVSEFWNDPKSAEREQRTQLLPLSLDRAQAVRNVMVLLGIDAERFTVTGFGGDRPVVPHGDLENRWKNRRVEFYLDRN